MEVKDIDADGNMEFEPHETKEIRLYFNPYNGRRAKETVMLFINDKEEQFSDQIMLEVTYHGPH